ncbi:VrrA/YqfQ family protein [Salibacterium sp. K-3]
MPDFYYDHPRVPVPFGPPEPPPPPFHYQHTGIPSFLFPNDPQRMPALQQFLPQLQQVLRFAQTAAPYVKQYYPIVRQLPTFLKLLSAAPASGPVQTTGVHDYSEDVDDETWETPPPKLYV